MPLPQFRVLTDAEARAQRRLQVNACMAARSAEMEAKDFKTLVKSLSDGH